MKKVHFDRLAKISNDYVNTINSMIPAYQQGEAGDTVYNAEVQQQRRATRTAEAAQNITKEAENMKKAASAEIEAMKAAFRKYMTNTSNPAALQSLTALIAGGAELTSAEIEAFAAESDFAILRLLEPRSRGRVTAPKYEAFDRDMGDIMTFFNQLCAYSGPASELAACIEARPWGQSARVNGAILKGTIPNFPGKLDTIAERWAVVKED